MSVDALKSNKYGHLWDNIVTNFIAVPNHSISTELIYSRAHFLESGTVYIIGLPQFMVNPERGITYGFKGFQTQDTNLQILQRQNFTKDSSNVLAEHFICNAQNQFIDPWAFNKNLLYWKLLSDVNVVCLNFNYLHWGWYQHKHTYIKHTQYFCYKRCPWNHFPT